jgi:hypothetical protein
MGAPIYPTRAQVRPVNPVVKGMINALANDPDDFIAHTFPMRQAPRSVVNGELRIHTSGTIFTVDPRDMFGSVDSDGYWAPKSAPSESIGVRPGNVVYQCARYGRDALVDLWTAGESEMPVNIDQVEMAAVLAFLRIKREERFASFVGTAGNWSNSITLGAGDEFGTASGGDVEANNSSNPIGVLKDAKEKILDWGRKMNYLLIPRSTARALQKHAGILEFLPTNERRITLTPNRLRSVLAAELEIPEANIHFGVARRNTASDDLPINLADIFGDTMWMGYVDPNPTVSGNVDTGDMRFSATAGVRIEAMPFTPDVIEDKKKAAESQRIWHAETFKPVMPELGCPIFNTIG